jgi:exopolysaccharide production protein ExoQ
MLKILEKAFIIFALVYFSQGLIRLLQPDDLPLTDEPPANLSMAILRNANKDSANDPTTTNKRKIAVEVGIYLITAGLILVNSRKFLGLCWRHQLLWLLLVLALFSAFWSDDPGFTFRRSLVLIASTSFGIYLATRYTLREILRMICIAGAVVAVASYVLVWRRPEWGIASGATDGDWQGIFSQKNTLGRFMALQMMAFTFGGFAEKGVWRLLCIAGCLLCLPLLIMSKDGTAHISIPVLMASLFLFQLARKRSLLRMLALLSTTAATVAGVLLMVTEPKSLFLMLGKDSTLTGRTEIWSMVWQKFLQRPWFGYGYSAFWLGKDGKQSAAIAQALHWVVPHSHNGLLDVLVQVGLVGLTLFFAGYVVFFCRALRCARASKTLLGLFPLSYLTFMLLFNLSEGSIIREESIFWILYAAIWVLTTRWLDLADEAARRNAFVMPTRKRALQTAVPAWQFRSIDFRS